MSPAQETPFQLCRRHGRKCNVQCFVHFTSSLSFRSPVAILLGFWKLELAPYLPCHVPVANSQGSSLGSRPER